MRVFLPNAMEKRIDLRPRRRPSFYFPVLPALCTGDVPVDLRKVRGSVRLCLQQQGELIVDPDPGIRAARFMRVRETRNWFGIWRDTHCNPLAHARSRDVYALQDKLRLYYGNGAFDSCELF
jgi:hypothetical protein